MKTIYKIFIGLSLLVSVTEIHAQVGIGVNSPHTSAQLDVTSTTKGFLPPRMSTTQRNAITNPAEGLTIYNTSVKCNQTFNGTAWVSNTHFVGESWGGGIVFYVYDNGQHGLIAAPVTLGPAYWRAGTDIEVLATADGVGAGKMNTLLIISRQGKGNGDNYAAKIAHEYSSTMDGVKYADWYLPSSEELNLLLTSGIPVNNTDDSWSSTEASLTEAYSRFVAQRYTMTKNNYYLVRPIRTF